MAIKTQNKKKVRQYVDQNSVEAFRDIGGSVADSVKNDLVAGSADSIWEQFFGGNGKSGPELSGDLIPGQEIDLLKTRETTVQEPVLPGSDYHREIRVAETKIIRENDNELTARIAQIQFELKKLANSSKELQVAFKQVTVEQAPVRAGKYHLNFFEWLFNVIKRARLKIDESRTWLSTLYQKRTKRQYWNMFKKHGTTFGLSGERVVATQTG